VVLTGDIADDFTQLPGALHKLHALGVPPVPAAPPGPTKG